MSKLKKKDCLYYLENSKLGILAVCINNEPFTYLIKYDLDFFNGCFILSFKLKKSSKLINVLKTNNNVAINICTNSNNWFNCFNNEIINIVAIGMSSLNEEKDYVVVSIPIEDIDGYTGLTSC